jgi:hypothetical protein
LTGYSREQVLGRNCRFLQGAGTDRRAIDVIRTAVANGIAGREVGRLRNKGKTGDFNNNDDYDNNNVED